MSFSYSYDPSDSDVDAVRFEIQDTNSSAFLLADTEIEWVILDENGTAAGTPTTITGPTLFLPAARCCEVIAQRFLQQADTQVGQLKVTSTKRAAEYIQRAKEMRDKAQSFFAPYAGGQSKSEDRELWEDADLTHPKFSLDEFNNPYAPDGGGGYGWPWFGDVAE